jgi:hypothetical protein
LEIVAPIALLISIVAGIAAAFMFWTSQTALRAGRGALFNTERNVALDRARRSRVTALALGGVAIVLLAINLASGGSAANVMGVSPTVTSTRTPRPMLTMLPTTREAVVATREAVAATLLPTASPTAPPQRAIVVNAGEPGLRLRQTPNGQEIDFLKDGTVLDLITEPQVTTADGITWQKVRDPQGREGWVATSYIAVQ